MIEYVVVRCREEGLWWWNWASYSEVYYLIVGRPEMLPAGPETAMNSVKSTFESGIWLIILHLCVDEAAKKVGRIALSIAVGACRCYSSWFLAIYFLFFCVVPDRISNTFCVVVLLALLSIVNNIFYCNYFCNIYRLNTSEKF